MQGESDANNPDTARAYRDNLTEIVSLFRAAMRDNDLPVALGRISDRKAKEGTGRTWAFGELVRAAQAEVAGQDPLIELVTSTDGYEYSDPYHYDSAGYLDLGERFANALDTLRGPAE